MFYSGCSVECHNKRFYFLKKYNFLFDCKHICNNSTPHPSLRDTFSHWRRLTKSPFSAIDIFFPLSKHKKAANCSAAFLSICRFDRLHGGKRRDSVLVDHLLLAIADQHHHKTVKACDSAPELKAIHQKQCHRDFIPLYLAENCFL